ncbi:MAG TPA: OmpA family protein [Myxococcales bacterium]
MGFKKLSDHLISMSLAAGLAACAGSQPVPDAQANKAEEKPAAVAEAPKPAPAPDANVAQGQAELEKAMEALRNVSVFFEFDSSTLTSEAKDKLSAVGTVLAKYAELKVRIEGNCDERGSEQYNLALGQRRADAAKRYLASMGAHDRQITAISFGDQKPKALGHDEEAWRQNRRDDLKAIPASYQSSSK